MIVDFMNDVIAKDKDSLIMQFENNHKNVKRFTENSVKWLYNNYNELYNAYISISRNISQIVLISLNSYD